MCINNGRLIVAAILTFVFVFVLFMQCVNKL